MSRVRPNVTSPNRAVAQHPLCSVAARLCAQYNFEVAPKDPSAAAATDIDAFNAPVDVSNGAAAASSSSAATTTNEKAGVAGEGDSSTAAKRLLPPLTEQRTLKEAIREANAAAKYLFVYLHAGDHEDTAHFATSVLGTHAATEKLREIALSHFVDAYAPEGRALEAQWSVARFPYCALLVKGRVVGDLQGRFTVDDFLDFLGACDDAARPVIHQEAAFIYERNFRERLRAEQEEEMAAAERTDRERIAAALRAAEEKKEAEEALRRTEAALRAEAAEAERKAAEEQRAREQAEAIAAAEREAAALALETVRAVAASALSEEPPETTEAALIATIRIVDLKGKQTNRRFLRSDALSSLYAFAKTLEGYSGGPFALMAGFPPRALASEAEAEVSGATIGSVPALVPRSVVTMKAL